MHSLDIIEQWLTEQGHDGWERRVLPRSGALGGIQSDRIPTDWDHISVRGCRLYVYESTLQVCFGHHGLMEFEMCKPGALDDMWKFVTRG